MSQDLTATANTERTVTTTQQGVTCCHCGQRPGPRWLYGIDDQGITVGSLDAVARWVCDECFTYPARRPRRRTRG